ncbi:MAG: ACT domain-containing protein, partial [Schwartzia sp.]|nr:ACT domain-containing protein [Schwartzia sp. (in: firmicutes)]
IVNGEVHEVGFQVFGQKQICPIEETVSAYYVRLLVADMPGVLGAIAMAFGDEGVSLNSVIQTRKVGDLAEIVAITHHVKHRRIARAERALSSLPVVTKISSVIRVETPPTTEVE